MNFTYQRPRRLVVEELTKAYGKFVAEPFERGYGSTIGIALRRVLLSMIEGEGITAVRIDGVLHEFSVIPGVYEDVLNIILNLKNVPFKLNVNEPRMIRIEKSEAGEVLSGDILCDNDVEVLDKNIHIAYLEEGGKFNCEMLIKKGVGYQLSEQNYDETLPVDFIPLDANFNPVEKVKYNIEPARVGKRTDYERMTLEVWTNGSVSPKETVSRAGRILRDHLAIFLDYKDKDALTPAVEQEGVFGIENKPESLEKSVEAMGLSVRALKCLKRLNVDYVYELIEKTEHELLNSKNFGKKSLEEIIQKLNDYDLALGQKLPDNLREELNEKYNRETVAEENDQED